MLKGGKTILQVFWDVHQQLSIQSQILVTAAAFTCTYLSIKAAPSTALNLSFVRFKNVGFPLCMVHLYFTQVLSSVFDSDTCTYTL